MSTQQRLPSALAAQQHPCNCPAAEHGASRRQVITLAAAGLAAPLCGWANPPQVSVRAGDRLLEDDAEDAKPLHASELRIGKPLVAYPADPAGGKPRNESRLNKVVLMRFAEAELPPSLRERAADGVLAYSAVCTHQSCDVKTWLAKEKVLVCYCHSSKFAPLEDARVTAGPAGRPLPWLPLKSESGVLVVSGPFNAPPGGMT